MTAFVKTPVGNKLFTVEWELETVSPSTVVGDTFEAVDCEMVSIHATAIGEGVLSKLSFGNKSTAQVSIALNSPEANVVMASPYPPVRFYTPTLEEAVGTSKVALLFKEI